MLEHGCETEFFLVVSIRMSGERVATLELRRTGEQWLVNYLAGKANVPCTGTDWSANARQLGLLHAGPLAVETYRTTSVAETIN